MIRFDKIASHSLRLIRQAFFMRPALIAVPTASAGESELWGSALAMAASTPPSSQQRITGHEIAIVGTGRGFSHAHRALGDRPVTFADHAEDIMTGLAECRYALVIVEYRGAATDMTRALMSLKKRLPPEARTSLFAFSPTTGHRYDAVQLGADATAFAFFSFAERDFSAHLTALLDT